MDGIRRGFIAHVRPFDQNATAATALFITNPLLEKESKYNANGVRRGYKDCKFNKTKTNKLNYSFVKKSVPITQSYWLYTGAQ
jgi:hypothetical protein